MNKNQKVVLGFVLGVTAGAVAALLLAPGSGEETRRRISEKANSLGSDLGNQLSSVLNKATKLGQDAIAGVTHAGHQVQNAGHQVQNAGQQAQNASQQAGNEAKNRVHQG